MDELLNQMEEIKRLLREDPENEELRNVASQLESAIETLKPAEAPKTENPLVGKNCEVFYLENWFTAKIIAIDKKDIARVQFSAQAVSHDFPIEKLRILQPLDPRYCTSGAKLQAVWSKDGKWYDCQIVSKIGEKYLVSFEGYKEREEVSPELLRRRPATPQQAQDDYVTPAGYRIPTSLKIDEKDNEKTKGEKKRKIHQIKSQQRIEKQEEEAAEKQNAWKAFNKKLRRSR